MYTKLEDRAKQKKEIIRQDNCQCACNSVTEDPDGTDCTIVAKNLATNQIQVDVATGDG